MPTIETPLLRLTAGDDADFLFSLATRTEGTDLPLSAPWLCLDGEFALAALAETDDAFERREAFPGVAEYTLRRAVTSRPGLTLELAVRVADSSPVVRFRYRLHADAPLRLTNGPDGGNALHYFGLPLLPEHYHLKEVRFSEFNALF